MDAALEIFLPVDANVSQFNFETPVFEWDGVLYPQAPPECVFGKNFKLRKHEAFDHYPKRDWPIFYQKAKLICLEVLGDGFDIYVSSLYGLKEEEPGFSLKDLINSLLHHQARWILIYNYEYDGYKEIVQSSYNEIMTYLENTIKNHIEGIMIYG